MNRFDTITIDRYIDAIETSHTYRQVLTKLGLKSNDYEPIKRIMREHHVKLLPKVSTAKELYGPYYGGKNSAGYYVLIKNGIRQRISVNNAIRSGLVTK